MTITTEQLVVPGLEGDAEILVDRWGIPHIRAAGLQDLFFVQGFNAARDRLWQLDLWRKRGLGLLAADFGPGYLAQDHASRLFLYRGPMDAEWAAYAPDAHAICARFTAGINAYVALTEREPDRLPPEFALLNTRPARWEPEDVVRIRSHGLTRNALSEVLRARVLAAAGQNVDTLRSKLDPPVDLSGDPGLALRGDIPLEVLTTFKLATAGVTFTPERLAAPLAHAGRWTRVTDLGEVVLAEGFTGSNNWVVHGSRTASGRPILANDPHRAHAVPSLRYIVHLSAPGFDAIGAGEPVAPGISLGHNGALAFGLTIFYSDQEDVYVYDTVPGAPERYRYAGGTEEMIRIEERFAVRGCDEQVLPMLFTRHGPVLYAEHDRHRAFAVRSVWFEPGSAAYMRSLTSMRATTVAEFREAMRGWGVPSSNHIVADLSGSIGWMPAGWTPVRANWSGLLPVPGDGRHEWAGFLDMDRLPRRIDPPEGFVATANEMNLPDGFADPVGHEWVDRSRATRLQEVLGADTAHTVAASCALQTDIQSVPARRVAALLSRIAGPPSAAASLLLEWDHELAADSAAASLFEVWWSRHLKPALFARFAPDPAVRAMLAPGHVDGILDALENPSAVFGTNPAAARDAMLATTLAAAFADCAALMGGDPAGWAWGRLHHAFFEHALSPVAAPDDRAVYDAGPLPHAGSGQTPMHTGYRPSDFRTIAGASVRLVMDVGNWDASMAINAPGQSGDPRSPHYRDLLQAWSTGNYVPMLYGRAAVDAAATLKLVLKPA
jgi:penicillin amidase